MHKEAINKRKNYYKGIKYMDEIKELKAQAYDILAQTEHITMTQLNPLREQLLIINKKIEDLHLKLKNSEEVSSIPESVKE